MGVKVVRAFGSQAIYLGNIDHGKDIIDTLETFCLENEVKTAWVNILGALSKVDLAYYDQQTHNYVTRTFEGEFEILNGTGNVSLKENKPVIHMHLSLSGQDFGCFGGHLVKGTAVVFACEFMIHALAGHDPLFRGHDEVTGLPLWIY